jgi:ABC-type multidrug transport system ATPase subunit
VVKGTPNSDLTIAFKDVSYSVQVPLEKDSYETFISPLVNTAKAIGTCGKSNAKKTFYRSKEISGVIKPGSMTLVIAPPGHGKSTYLKLLANRLPLQSGKVAYNGRSMDEAAAEGVDLKKMTQYVDQVDTHLPLLTVTETLDFAHKVSSHKYDPERVSSTVSLLGLDECKDTILGNAFVRGVSGGQKRRVTIGEMLVSDACALFLDEFTNGLDTATSEDIARGLRNWCDSTNGTIVSTLQQPTPGLYNTFDDIVILREGQVVFHGPREDVLPYFEAMGFRCPGDVDVCDFLIDVLSQPRLSLQRQRDADKKDTKAGKTVPTPHLTASFGEFTLPAKPCVTTEDMAEYYQSTPLWAATKKQLDVYFPENSTSTDKSAFTSLMPTEESKAMFKTGFVMPVSSLARLVFDRQVKLVYRDKNLVFPRVFTGNMVLMGLILVRIFALDAIQ